MPHDVIMPALGMAQDSGVLVAWLKSPGEPVKAGEGLMEVETDKATMEVEAEADGYLTEVRVQAGETAPVGGIVAVIAESPVGEKTGGAVSAAAKPAPASREAAPAPAPSEGKPVIMPALGMAQDSGAIVAWSKAVGDPVGEDDTLFEVETDKAAMEVPAGADGFLAARYFEAGDSVPVGEVIALISAEKPAGGAARPPKPAAAPASALEKAAEKAAGPPDAKAAPAAARDPAPAPPMAAASDRAPGGMILASPKARRLARERGIDLRRLLDAGAPQPIHAEDLDRFAEAARAQTFTPSAALAAPQAQTGCASAEVPAGPFAAFLDWLAEETGGAALRGESLAAFAAAAFREATGAERVGLALGPVPRAPERRFADPDRLPLSAIAAADEAPAGDAPPDLRLRDLGATAITGLRLGGAAAPALSVSVAGETLRIDYEGALPPDQAVALLDGFAARLADPTRHLL
jgi:pyruvate/2-oxoglutarate dehydrogenase complex dihydrolipoamide acyltransferase (E2) component